MNLMLSDVHYVNEYVCMCAVRVYSMQYGAAESTELNESNSHHTTTCMKARREESTIWAGAVFWKGSWSWIYL